VLPRLFCCSRNSVLVLEAVVEGGDDIDPGNEDRIPIPSVWGPIRKDPDDEKDFEGSHEWPYPFSVEELSLKGSVPGISPRCIRVIAMRRVNRTSFQ
jgi:hypothetical protein